MNTRTMARESSGTERGTNSPTPDAFTRLELLAVLCVLGLLGSLVIPNQARGRSGGQSLYCLNNLRQLMAANALYCGDNRDHLPMVLGFAYTPLSPPQDDRNRPWAWGRLDWARSPENTNLVYLLNPRYASLASYFGRDHRIYKCPADVFVSPAQRGWGERLRSVSANACVGEGNTWASGFWGNPSGPNNPAIYKGAAKAAELNIPGPARTWVYVDEHPDSISYPVFLPPITALSFLSVPATQHNGAGGLAMADGHCELHRWRGVKMNQPRSLGGFAGVAYNSLLRTTAGDPDLFWLSYGSPRWTTRTVSD